MLTVPSLPLESLQAVLTAAKHLSVAIGEDGEIPAAVNAALSSTIEHARVSNRPPRVSNRVPRNGTHVVNEHDMSYSNSSKSGAVDETDDQQQHSADRNVSNNSKSAAEGNASTFAAETARAAISAMGPNDNTGEVNGNEELVMISNHENNHEGETVGSPLLDFDLSDAPQDPTALALWVAKQIHKAGAGVDLDYGRSESQEMRGPSQFYNRIRHEDDDDPERAAERERVRLENRERKKRWRESNADRNKDNDLRCRINKRAKKLFPEGNSAQKTAWMESEFRKRRAKREAKERNRSYDDDDGFSLPAGICNDLFPNSADGPQAKRNMAGHLLANALLGNGNGPDQDSANALKAALESGTVDAKPFVEALRVMASNPDIMNGIKAILRSSEDYDEGGDPHSGDEEITVENEAQGEPVDENDQSELVKALHAATAMLTSMEPIAGEAGDLTESAGTNGFTAINDSENSKAKKKDRRPSEAANSHGLDQAQIDEFLQVANGGPLAGHADDNESLADTVDENPDRVKEHSHGPQPDTDISATLQILMNKLKRSAEDEGEESSDSKRRRKSSSSISEPNDKHTTAMALNSLLKCATMSINTVIPAGQGRATSELYTRLSHHSRSSTPSGGGINPAFAESFGTTATMNERVGVLSKPNHFHRPLYIANNTAQRIVVPQVTSKLKREEAEKKARSFGFPPLPGGKPGAEIWQQKN